jgi:hypothetical protein
MMSTQFVMSWMRTRPAHSWRDAVVVGILTHPRTVALYMSVSVYPGFLELCCQRTHAHTQSTVGFVDFVFNRQDCRCQPGSTLLPA